MKIYIAGKINGDNNYKAKFKKAFDYCSQEGMNQVLNPAELPAGFSPEDYMKICFAMIDVCDTIYFLNDWKESKGATLEHTYAEYIGKRIEYQEGKRNENRII